MAHRISSFGTTSSGGSSRIAQSFDAKIDLETSDLGMFFIIGHHDSIVEVIKGVGGKIVFRLPDTPKMLAVMPVTSFLELQRHPEIALIGPVSVDQERFSRFASMVDLDNARSSAVLKGTKTVGKVPDNEVRVKPSRNRKRRKK